MITKKGKIVKTTVYYDEGKIRSKGLIDKKGKKQGVWKNFYVSGELKSEGIYKNGRKEGTWKYFYRY